MVVHLLQSLWTNYQDISFFSSIDLLLERLCLEGTRKQAKYSVHALAAITKDDGLKSLSVLYKVDMVIHEFQMFLILSEANFHWILLFSLYIHVMTTALTAACGYVGGENTPAGHVAIFGLYCSDSNANFWNQGGWNSRVYH